MQFASFFFVAAMVVSTVVASEPQSRPLMEIFAETLGVNQSNLVDLFKKSVQKRINDDIDVDCFRTSMKTEIKVSGKTVQEWTDQFRSQTRPISTEEQAFVQAQKNEQDYARDMKTIIEKMGANQAAIEEFLRDDSFDPVKQLFKDQRKRKNRPGPCR